MPEAWFRLELISQWIKISDVFKHELPVFRLELISQWIKMLKGVDK